MSLKGKTALVTGGASGIGRSVTEMLTGKGVKVYLLDRDLKGAQAVADTLNDGHSSDHVVRAIPVDVSSWESQLKAFKAVLRETERIDFVFPIAGIGERSWITNNTSSIDFAKPDLTVFDVDVYGVLYTVSLAIQQFRRQDKDQDGYKGKIACVASVCGFYCVPTLPIYTAAKHAIVGFVRSYGKYMATESITINAACPNVVRTNISTGAFYDALEVKGLLTPMQGVIEAMEHFLTSSISGEVMEIGPNGGFVNRPAVEHLDEESALVCEELRQRGLRLQQPAE